MYNKIEIIVYLESNYLVLKNIETYGFSAQVCLLFSIRFDYSQPDINFLQAKYCPEVRLRCDIQIFLHIN